MLSIISDLVSILLVEKRREKNADVQTKMPRRLTDGPAFTLHGLPHSGLNCLHSPFPFLLLSQFLRK